MRLRVAALVLGVTLCAGVAAGQRRQTKYSFAIEYRRQVGVVPDSSNRRGGLAIRLTADGPWTTMFGWRLEGAYTQSRYDFKDANGSTPISETGFELGAMGRATRRVGVNWRPYVAAGPIFSLRGSCAVDNPFTYNDVVPCKDGNTIRVGWGGGAGVRYAAGLAGWDWFFETRLLGNLTSNGGGKSVAFAFGAGY